MQKPENIYPSGAQGVDGTVEKLPFLWKKCKKSIKTKKEPMKMVIFS